MSNFVSVFSRTMLFCVALSTLPSCSSDNAPPVTPATQKRVYQTRTFDAPSKEVLLQAVLASLQDQSYNIVKVNNNNAEITAQKDGNIIISVIVYPTGNKQYAVRANAQYFDANTGWFSNNLTGYKVIDDPVFYQKDFFEPLSKSIFLQKENLSN